MPSLGPILDVLHSLVALAIIGLAAYGIGRPALRQLSTVDDDPLAVTVWSLALGLLLAGSALLALGWAGWLYVEVVTVASLAAVFWAFVELICVYLSWINGQVLNLDQARAPRMRLAELPWPIKIAGSLAVLMLLASFVAALAPPTSAEALSHSLAIPKSALLHHSTLAGGGPRINLVQMWFLWALALDGPVAANLVHWGLGLLLALSAMLLARPLFGARPAILAGCLVLLCPGVHLQMAAPLEDLGFALFTTLALSAVFHVLVRFETGAWPWLAGLALGAAVAAKPAGSWFVLAIVVAWGYGCWSQREARGQLRSAGCRAALATVLVAAPWILPMAISPDVLRHQSIPSALGHLGPLLSMAVLGLVFARRVRGLDVVILVMFAFAALSAIGPAAGRWWSAVVPLASVVGVWVWQEMDRLPRRVAWVVHGAAAIVVMIGLAPCGWAAIEASAVAVGWQTRDAFLLSRVSTYRASSLLNQISRQGQDVLCQDARTFYFACPATSRSDVRYPQISNLSPGGEEQWVSLARSAGYSYLLMAQGLEPDSTAIQRDGAGGFALDPSHARSSESSAIGEVIPILEYRFADDNNRYTRYRLLKIR